MMRNNNYYELNKTKQHIMHVRVHVGLYYAADEDNDDDGEEDDDQRKMLWRIVMTLFILI